MKFTNKGQQRGEILIYEDIGQDFGGLSAKTFTEELTALGDVRQLDIRINSYGGEVFQGFPIYNAIKRHAANVHVYIDGIAASIASVIAMAGDQITIAKNGQLMIHEAHAFAWGRAGDFDSMSGKLRELNDQIKQVYIDRITPMYIDRVAGWMEEEKYFTADEAMQYGFADQIEDYPVQIAAYNPAHHFKNPPAVAKHIEGDRISVNDERARAAMVYMQQNLKR